jgi:hypothetical protein
MVRRFMLGVASLALIGLATGAMAQQASQGTAAEAKAMLQKTVTAVKADQAKALDMIAKGEGGFLDRDLYPFCFNAPDGKVHPFPNPNAKAGFGTDQRAAKDAAGAGSAQPGFQTADDGAADVP